MDSHHVPFVGCHQGLPIGKDNLRHRRYGDPVGRAREEALHQRLQEMDMGRTSTDSMHSRSRRENAINVGVDKRGDCLFFQPL